MLTIGQFAQACGLTVKALHFYDARGVLCPAEVDPDNGYRRYRSSQLREAGALKALRAADVPLDRARRLVDEADRSSDLLDVFVAEVAADRARQDRAVATARRVLDLMATEVVVRTREVAASDYVGLRWQLGPDQDLDAISEEYEHGLGLLAAAVHAATGAAAGPFWTTFRAAEIEVCLPVAVPLAPEDLTGASDDRTGAAVVVAGRLAAGTEAYTEVSVDDLTLHGQLGAPPPAMIALGEHLDGVTPAGTGREMRQVAVPGDDGTPVAMQFVTALPAS